MAELLVVVPSRGRPGNITRLVEAMEKTCRAGTDLIVGLDSDDPQLPAYTATWPYMPAGWIPPDGTDGDIHSEGMWPYKVQIRSGMRSVVPWVNYLALQKYQHYGAVGHFGDDNLPETIGWDVDMLMALEETPFAFANDLYPRAPGSLCCHVFMRSEVVGKLGYFGPPGIRHMYVDVAWMAWGTKCGFTYRHDVLIEHLHFTKGQAGFDESYQASQGLIPIDLNNWHQYCDSGQLNADIEKIGGGTPFTQEELSTFNRNLNIPRYWGAPVA